MGEELVKTIFSRRSIRKYTEESVPEEHVTTILEAAMAAPSASNRKPWHFVTVTERDTLNRLADAHKYAKMLHEAPYASSYVGTSRWPNASGRKTVQRPPRTSSWQPRL